MIQMTLSVGVSDRLADGAVIYNKFLVIRADAKHQIFDLVDLAVDTAKQQQCTLGHLAALVLRLPRTSGQLFPRPSRPLFFPRLTKRSIGQRAQQDQILMRRQKLGDDVRHDAFGKRAVGGPDVKAGMAGERLPATQRPPAIIAGLLLSSMTQPFLSQIKCAVCGRCWPSAALSQRKFSQRNT